MSSTSRQTNAANKGLRGVVFALLDGDKYPDFAVGVDEGSEEQANFGVEPNEPMLWFTKGTSVSVWDDGGSEEQAPIVADVKTDVDNIFKFATSHMVEVDDSEIRDETGGEEEELQLGCLLRYMLPYILVTLLTLAFGAFASTKSEEVGFGRLSSKIE